MLGFRLANSNGKIALRHDGSLHPHAFTQAYLLQLVQLAKVGLPGPCEENLRRSQQKCKP